MTGLRISAIAMCGVICAVIGSMARAQSATAPEVPAKSQQITIHLDAGKSKIEWVLHDTIHTVNGTFQLKGGLITFNFATGVADGELLVDVSTGASGNATRDNKMKTQVLETQKFPTAFFHQTMVTGAIRPGTTQQLTVQGTLNIHGADHPITLKVDVKADGSMVTATTHFAIPYVAWGMRDPSIMLIHVGKQVDVTVIAQGTVEKTP
jgi:polyisoprenoid-binding protein YceI